MDKIILLLIMCLLIMYERKPDIKKVVDKKEYPIAFCLYLFLTFLGLGLMGILDSGYHMVDDHEIYIIGQDIKNSGFWITLLQWLQKDLNIRFRFTYYIIRIIECAVFGTNFMIWHVFYTFLAGVSLFLAYVFARKMKCPIWLSYAFSILIFSGNQAAVFWRLGPQENLGVILLFLVLISLLDYTKKKTLLRTILLVGLTILLGGIKEAFLLLLPMLPILLVYWQIREEEKLITYQSVIDTLKENWFYIGFTWIVFIIDMFIVLFVVGTNKIGYAGIDPEFGLFDYIKEIIRSCLFDEFRIYFAAILVGILFYVIPSFITIVVRKKIDTEQVYLAVEFLMFVYFIGTQLVLHAKSGMYERYLLPATVGFGIFCVLNLYVYAKGSKLLFVIFISLTLIAALFDSDIWEDGTVYADEGKNITCLVETISQFKEGKPNIVVALGYELDFSISVYLQEEFGMQRVYNVYYTGYEDGIACDGYMAEKGCETILFEDADMFVGYSDNLLGLVEERKVTLTDYNQYDFGKFSLFISKAIDK